MFYEKVDGGVEKNGWVTQDKSLLMDFDCRYDH